MIVEEEEEAGEELQENEEELRGAMEDIVDQVDEQNRGQFRGDHFYVFLFFVVELYPLGSIKLLESLTFYWRAET